MDIKLTWSEFTSIINVKKLFVQYFDKGSSYDVWAEDHGMTYITSIVKESSSKNISGLDSDQEEANQTEFETSYKSDANRPLTAADSALQSWFEGKQIEIDGPSASGICEWQFGTDSYINKICVIPMDAEFGDYVDLTMHYISALDPNETQVGQYAKNMFLEGNQPSSMWFYGNGAGKIPYGIKVRCTYNKTGSNLRKFIIIAEFLK